MSSSEKTVSEPETNLNPSLAVLTLNWGISSANSMLEKRHVFMDQDLRSLFTIAAAALNEVRVLKQRVSELERECVALKELAATEE